MPDDATRPQISVMLPAFNEIGSIREVVFDAKRALAAIPGQHEILIVDDGSTDGTSSAADELAAEDGRVRVIHHDRNVGFGGAIASCFRHARGRWLFLAPADGQIPLSALHRFVEVSNDADIVVGRRSRRVEGTGRALPSWIFHVIVRALFGLPLAEFSSSFLFRREAVEGKWISRGDAAAILPEVLYRAQQRGLRLRTVGTEHLPRTSGRSKGASVKVALLTLVELVRLAIVLRWRSPEGARPKWRERTVALLLTAVTVLTAVRLLHSGFIWPWTTHSWLALQTEQLPPLFGLVLDGRPITEIDARQYGVVVFLIVHPLLLVVGRNFQALELALLVVAHAAVLGALILVWLRLFKGWGWRALLLFVAFWYNFTPIYHILGIKNVDAWQLFFLSAGFFLYTSADPRHRALAGIPIGAAILTKLLPIVVLSYFAIRDRRAFATGCATIVALLAVGHALYGPLMGLLYLPNVALRGSEWALGLVTWYENDAVRGIVYKVFAGFRLLPTYFLDISPSAATLAARISDVLTVAVGAYLIWVAWRGRHMATSTERQAVEYSFATVVMLLASTLTPHEFMLLALPAYSTCLWLLARSRPVTWPRVATAALAVSIVLVGTFVPMSVIVRMFPLALLIDASGAYRLDLSQAYRYFLFPAAGLLCLAAVIAWLERRTGRASTGDRASTGSARQGGRRHGRTRQLPNP